MSSQNEEQSTKLPINHLRYLSPNLTSIHFIGDLHGDVDCARRWVQRTNLVNITSRPYQWIGNNVDTSSTIHEHMAGAATNKPSDQEAIVFLGDYVDKGSQSRHVLEFIRELQTTFPNNVLAMMGNHDFYLFMDVMIQQKRLERLQTHEKQNQPGEKEHYEESLLMQSSTITTTSNDKEQNHNANLDFPMGQPVHDFTYAFIHPEEYVQAKWSPERDDDEEILSAIYEALDFVYHRNVQDRVYLCAPPTSQCHKHQIDIFTSIPPFINNQTLAIRARDRLKDWRIEYADGLVTSGLLDWIGTLPVVAIVGDTIAVHGGISPKVWTLVEDYISKINDSMDITKALHSLTSEALKEHQSNLNPTSLEIILELLNYRGYFRSSSSSSHEHHETKSQNNVNEKVKQTIDNLQTWNVHTIVVGHTPHSYATELYNSQLLASDSSLSRSFRAYGNLYCPIRHHHDTRNVPTYSQGATPMNDQRRTPPIPSSVSSACWKVRKLQCEGSITHMIFDTESKKWLSHPIYIQDDDDEIQIDMMKIEL